MSHHWAFEKKHLRGWLKTTPQQAPMFVGTMLGIGLALGQAPFGMWFVTLAIWTTTLLLLSKQKQWQHRLAFTLGLGMGHNLLLLSWIVNPFLVFPETSGWIAPWAWLGLSLSVTMFWVIPAVLASSRWGGITQSLLFITGLLAGEWIRGNMGDWSFRWNLIGHIWVDTPMLQLARTSEMMLSIATLTMSLMLALLWQKKHKQAIATGLTCTALSTVSVFGPWAAQPRDIERVVVRVVQPNIDQKDKWNRARAQQQDQSLMEKIAHPANHPLNLIVLPETATQNAFDTQSFPDAALQNALSHHQHTTHIIVGANRQDGTNLFNSLRVITQNGKIKGQHDKTRLTPFGETNPLHTALPFLFKTTGITGHSLDQGQNHQHLHVNGVGNIWPMICYESTFPIPREARNPTDLILIITNDGWIGQHTGPWQHLVAARIRAVETGRQVLRVGNQGITAHITERGDTTFLIAPNTNGFADWLIGDGKAKQISQQP